MRHSLRKPAGVVIITPEFGPQEAQDCSQCPHCGGHFVMQQGSGTERGWCFNCNAVTCGGKHCLKCVPTERWFEAVEKKATQALRGY